MSIPVNKIICGDWIEVAETLPSGLVHCIITSPPYWGQRNYGVEGQLGLEKTPEEHIEKLVVGFHELRRVLRDDGCVFVNYGAKMADKQGDMMELRDDLAPSELSYVLHELVDDNLYKDK